MLKKLLQSIDEFYYWPNNGNLGDLLIAEATYYCFRKLGLVWKLFDPNNPPAERDITLVYGGGGRFTSHYPDGLETIINHLTAPNVKRGIILPHSFFDVDNHIKALDERHTIICREQRSYEYCRSLPTKAEVLLSDDMALQITGVQLPQLYKKSNYRQSSEYERRQHNLLKTGWAKRVIKGVKHSTLNANGIRIAFLLRRDKEKQSHLNSLHSYDISMVWDDICHPSPYNATLIRTFAKALRYPDTIVTDRLHVGIMGYLLGKEVYLLDNDYGKLSGVYHLSLATAQNVHLLTHGILTRTLQNAWDDFNAMRTKSKPLLQEREYKLRCQISKLKAKYKKAAIFSILLPGKYYSKRKEKLSTTIKLLTSDLEELHQKDEVSN